MTVEVKPLTRGLIDIEVLELLRKRGMKPLTLGHEGWERLVSCTRHLCPLALGDSTHTVKRAPGEKAGASKTPVLRISARLPHPMEEN